MNKASPSQAPAPSNREAVADSRHVSYGLARLLFVLLAIGAAVFTWRGVIACTNAFLHGSHVAGVMDILACAAWICGVVGMVHNGRRMRILSWCAWIANVAGSLASRLFAQAPIDPASPWYGGGATYVYLPILGTCAALIWLAWSSPKRMAARGG